ncbi:MAG TPA: S16 family serine protease [Acidimicrobiales bacterium]|nr:S16 family serine protease [Acidimicrobiales bacterium]
MRVVELVASGETAQGDDALAGRPTRERIRQPCPRRGPGIVAGAHEGLEADRYRIPIVGHNPIPPPDRVRRRWRTLAGAVLVLVLAGVVTARVPLNEYALTPGHATPVAPLVHVQGVATARHPGDIYLTDVYLQQLSALSWLALHLTNHVQFVPADALTPPGVPTSELAAQGYLQMRDAQLAAEVEAFRTVGWRVPSSRVGATVTGVVVPSPASRAGLAVGDVVTAVAGHRVADACGLVAGLHGLAPGSVVRLRVRGVRISATGVLSWRGPRTVTVTTTTPPAGIATSGCPGVTGPDRSFLGVTLEDDVAYRLPARVRIDTANIGGPSAGLAMTLTLVDLLSRHSITGGRGVAATGTMAVGGAVGPVGGVAQKAVAVERAGARIFIVPRSEVGAARSGAPGLRVLGVTTLAQALADLRTLGGAAPDPLSAPPTTSG